MSAFIPQRPLMLAGAIVSLLPSVGASSLLVTQALLQCPFEPQEVTETQVQNPELPTATNVKVIRQSDMENGPVEIREPGTYEVEEDLLMDFPQLDFKAGFWHDGLHVGKANAIEIMSDNVILDFKGHTIKQSPRHFKWQRFTNLVVIGNQPFPKGKGGYTGELKPQKKIVIKNGNFGLTSHLAIRGHASSDVLIENCKFRDFEVAAVSFNSATKITIKDCTADNSDFKLSVGTNAANFFLLMRTMKWAEFINETFPPSDGFPEKFLNDPLVQHINDLQGEESQTSAAARDFLKHDGDFAIGNTYGLAHISNCTHVVIDGVDIRNVHNTGGRVKAVQDLTGKQLPVTTADDNVLLFDWFFDNEGNRRDNKQMTELEAFKVLCFKAQVWSMKKFVVLEARFMERVTEEFVRDVLDPNQPEIPNIKVWLGADIRAHPDDGLSAIGIKGHSQHVKISNVKISTLSNNDDMSLDLHTPADTWDVTEPGVLRSEPNVWRGARFSHQIAHMADAYGIRISTSHNVQVHNVEVRGISSVRLHAFGVAVTGECRNVGISDVVVDANSVEGGMFPARQIPFLKAKGMPFYKDTQGQVNVGFTGINPELLYVAPAGDCDTEPSGRGCPVDGVWGHTDCSSVPTPTPGPTTAPTTTTSSSTSTSSTSTSSTSTSSTTTSSTTTSSTTTSSTTSTTTSSTTAASSSTTTTTTARPRNIIDILIDIFGRLDRN